jgi:hypothetical protein
MSAGEQRVGEMAADEARGARHQILHRGITAVLIGLAMS